MKIEHTPLFGLTKFYPQRFGDVRGFFVEQYRSSLYEKEGLPPFVQDNLSLSSRGTVRGLHFQRRPGQAKLVSCLQGCIWDVVVDLREDSPTFGQWEGVELSEEGGAQLYVPVGFGHGFAVLSQEARVFYKVSTFYDPAEERTVRWDDPDLCIGWPLKAPLLSPRDAAAPSLREVFPCMCG